MTRVALVTGAARGIGAATTLALAAQDWCVVALDRAAPDDRLPYGLGTAEELAAVTAGAEAIAGPGRVLSVVGDASDAAAMAGAVDAAESAFGGLDAVIAVAGVIAGGVPLWDMPEPELDAVLEVDLRAVIVAARVGVPALLRRAEPREGRFLAVASAAASSGLPLLAAYCAAKAGVVGLVRALATELAGTGVTANAVSPGSTDTAILAESARLYGLEAPASFASQQPIRRLIAPEEVAAALVWLAGSDRGALTGAILAIDGGLTL